MWDVNSNNLVGGSFGLGARLDFLSHDQKLILGVLETDLTICLTDFFLKSAGEYFSEIDFPSSNALLLPRWTDNNCVVHGN